MKPHIYAIFPHFLPRVGGAEHHLYQLANQLTNLGYRVTILAPLFPPGLAVERQGLLEIRRFGDDTCNEGHLQAFREIAREIESIEDESLLYVALCTGGEERTMLFGRFLQTCRERGIPTVVRITSSHKIEELQTIYPPILDDLRSADAIIALNSGIVAELSEVGVKAERIRMITNGVNTEMFYQTLQPRVSAEKPLVFFSGSRFVAKKKIERLFDLWATLETKIPAFSSKTRLVVLGDDHQEGTAGQFFAEMSRRAANFSNVSLLSSVPHTEMGSHLRSADAYIAFSTQEGLSNAMLEAMACGLPILAPATDATTIVVRDGENGILFEPDDLPSAQKAVEKFLGLSVEARQEMGCKNVEKIWCDHRIEAVAEQFSQLFVELQAKASG